MSTLYKRTPQNPNIKPKLGSKCEVNIYTLPTYTSEETLGS